MTLAALLDAHHPTDEKEAADLREMRGFAVSLSEPFSRSQWPAHFTGSAVVVTPDGTKVCLVMHAKLQRWLQPGGHADVADGGSMDATALREAREETGCEVALHATAPRPIDVDVHVIPARKTEPEHRHLDVRYLVVAKNPEALAHDPNESEGAQWLSWDEAIARADEAPLRRMLAKARALVTKSRWHDGADSLMALLGRVVDGAVVRLPAQCGACQRGAVHIYFHKHNSRGSGGVWVWCSSCGGYFHGSGSVPVWWRNPEVVDAHRLAHRPDYLDELAQALDSHWNAVSPG